MDEMFSAGIQVQSCSIYEVYNCKVDAIFSFCPAPATKDYILEQRDAIDEKSRDLIHNACQRMEVSEEDILELAANIKIDSFQEVSMC